MEEDKKKKLINEKITGRKMTPARILRLVIAAGICGVVFGTVSAYTFGFVNSRLAKQAAQNESTAAETEETPSSPEGLSEPSGADAPGLQETESGAAGQNGAAAGENGAVAGESGQAGAEAGEADQSGAAGQAGAGDESAASEEGSSGTEESSGTGKEESTSEASGDAASSGNGQESGNTSGKNGSAEDGSGKPGSEDETSAEDGSASDGETEADGEKETIDPANAELLRDPEFIESVFSMLSESIAYADSYLVSVMATSQEPSWFDTSTESSKTYSGIIISADKNEILILTTCTDTDQKSFKVIFKNGSMADAQFKQSSATDGLSVFAVSASSGISEETLASIVPVEFGDTSLLKTGSPLIAVGAPMGIPGSSDFSNIGYIDPDESGIDCSQEIYYADICSNSEMGTFFIDPEGKLIGLAASASAESKANQRLSRIISISSLERLIKALSEGEKKAFLGVSGVSVDFNMKYSNVPEGVYVSNVIQDSPAYTAGIRRGDVIINVTDSISERHITDLDVLTRAVSNAKPGETVTITVMRSSPGSEYREMNFEIVFGER